MGDFQSKYNGPQVEEMLDQIANGEAGGGGGGITVETDPVFSASPAASITEEKKAEWDNKQDAITDLETIRSGAKLGATALQSVPSEYVTETELNDKGYATTSALNNKVDKVSGKGLSTEDFTSALKAKLEGLNNYDDTEIENALSTLRGDFDKLVSGDTTTAIKSFNDIIAFLDGIQDTQDLSSIIASIQQQIAGKQDTITDLATIRSGAAAGSTAVQPSSLAKVATSGSYNDLSDKPTIPSAVTKSTVSGWGFGTYSKPSDGIPKTDLASAVQTSLGKADTALQSYTEQYKGTVTKVKINGSEKSPDANGVVDLGTIEGGGGGDKEIVGISNQYGRIAFGSSGNELMRPNVIYVQSGADDVASVFIQFADTTELYSEYTLIFKTTDDLDGADFTMSLPSTVKWVDGKVPTVELDTVYELSIARTKMSWGDEFLAVLAPFKS